jgi:hypothetical protein
LREIAVARGDSPPVFEAADDALDRVAALVEGMIKGLRTLRSAKY